jgi:UDP-glucuronate 4-epimerase
VTEAMDSQSPTPTYSQKTPILVTGVAGFIGFHVAQRFLAEGYHVVGVDCFTPYYDVSLKKARLTQLEKYKTFIFLKHDLADVLETAAIFQKYHFDYIIHLAAQPGVRAALTDPHPYIQSNITAFLNVLEGCRHINVKHLIYASSSSVYGLNRQLPFSEHTPADHPISLYAATKRAGELMAHSYADLFHIPMTGLRFFTVYGPWGRPDMAVYQFTDKISRGVPIDVANNGEVWRDFTYVDDVVEGIIRLHRLPPQPDTEFNTLSPDPARSRAPHRVYNIGNDHPEKLNDLIKMIEHAVGREANRIVIPLPQGDVLETRADITDLRNAVDFAPRTPLQEGVKHFVSWYQDYMEKAPQP